MIIRNIKTEKEAREVFDMSKSYTDNHQTFREFMSKYRKYPDLFFAAYQNEKLVGEVVGYVRDDGFCELHSIAVFGTMWNKGIGTKLIRIFEKACNKYSPRVCVSTLGKPERFYFKMGYKIKGLLAIYEDGKRLPKDLDVKPLEMSYRKRDNTLFAFFLTPKLTLSLRKRLVNKFKASQVCVVFEKSLKQKN